MYKTIKVNYLFFIAALIYFVYGSVFHFTGWFSFEDCGVFNSAVSGILDGSFKIYTFRGSDLVAPPYGNTFDYLGLPAYLMLPSALVARLSNRDPCRLYGLTFMLIDILCIWELRRLIQFIKPDTPPKIIEFISIALFGSYVLVYTSARLNHFDSLLVYFTLLSIRYFYTNKLLSGIFFGLALVTKQVVIIGLIPFTLLLLSDFISRRKIWEPLTFYLPIAGMVCIFFMPFYLADPQSAIWGVFTSQNNRTILWWSSYRLLEIPVKYEIGTALAQSLLVFFQYYSNYVIIGSALFATALVMKVNFQKNLPYVIGIFALLFLLIPLLGKWSGPSYALPGLLFFILWDTLRVNDRYGFPFFSVGFLILQGRLYDFEDMSAINLHHQPSYVSVGGSLMLYGAACLYVFFNVLKEHYGTQH